MDIINNRTMYELSSSEIEKVSGGLSLAQGGLAITAIGLGALTGPLALGAFAVGLGTTMLVGGTMAEEGMS
ncbi:MAG: hypothetical protein V7708_03795 [Oceanicoccus sp.]